MKRILWDRFLKESFLLLGTLLLFAVVYCLGVWSVGTIFCRVFLDKDVRTSSFENASDDGFVDEDEKLMRENK